MVKERQFLYGLVEASDLFIPSISDPALTKDKLREILAQRSIALPMEIIEEFDHPLRVASVRLKDAIIELR